MTKKYGKVGFIGRFKPLHNGAYIVLEKLCEQADKVIIGIGSTNKYNLRNPFTAEESAGMINAALSKKFENYEIIEIPDFGHIPENSDGQRWKEFVKEKFEGVEYFFSGNGYVRELLKDSLKLKDPTDVLNPEQRVALKAAKVRLEMALYGDWEELVPKEVAKYLNERGIVDRFRNEFGLETIAQMAEGEDYSKRESALAEKMHVREM